MLSTSALVCFAFLAVVTGTDVEQCPNHSIEGLSDMVQLIPCKRPPCKLKKGTSQQISIRFTPEKDHNDITNAVSAEVFGVPLPFVGVDGSSICDKLETPEGGKASCPVKAGNTYVYKDSFPILSFYPNIDVRVHWALKSQNKDIACFEVPAKIKS